MIQRAKSPVARGERSNRLVQLVLPEIRPEYITDVKLRVADLPEKIIADAHLAGGADKQIGIGHAGGVEMLGDGVFIDVAWIELAGLHLLCDRPDTIDNLRAA